MSKKVRFGSGPKLSAPVSEGPEALAAFGLTPETIERLTLYEALLKKWQRTINLVAPSTLDNIWTRHFADSLQVSDALPAAKLWMDLGSGAGFPGLVTAIRLVNVSDARVHLVESDQRKCAFLRDVSRETGAPVEIHNCRIEALLQNFEGQIEAISARALAPLQTLIQFSEKLLEKGAIGVFPQGEKAWLELTDSRLASRFSVRESQGSMKTGSRLAVVQVKSAI